MNGLPRGAGYAGNALSPKGLEPQCAKWRAVMKERSYPTSFAGQFEAPDIDRLQRVRAHIGESLA
jgi:hypothetical protein